MPDLGDMQENMKFYKKHIEVIEEFYKEADTNCPPIMLMACVISSFIMDATTELADLENDYKLKDVVAIIKKSLTDSASTLEKYLEEFN